MERTEEIEADIRELKLRIEEINTNLENQYNLAQYRKKEINEMIENKQRLIGRIKAADPEVKFPLENLNKFLKDKPGPTDNY